MCTVTFIAQKRGYCLGMNRDEKLTRPAGLAPGKRVVSGETVLGPSESNGGTWIALNGRGVTLALINWYSIAARVKAQPVSRGEVVKAVSVAAAAEIADNALVELPLNRINPFRLIGIYPATNEIAEWRWNLNRLVRNNHSWHTQQWISSGYDESKAELIRSRTFRGAQKQASAGSLEWLRRLHRSHTPESGPFSTCMLRKDAATVSYTEISVAGQRARMRYYAGAPCHSKFSVHQIRLR